MSAGVVEANDSSLVASWGTICAFLHQHGSV